MSGLKTKTVEITMGDCKIVFYSRKTGDPLKAGENAYSNMWQLIMDGVDPVMIKSVEIPKLTYKAIPELFTIKVEMYTSHPMGKTLTKQEKKLLNEK